jgi:hypothetical protein
MLANGGGLSELMVPMPFFGPAGPSPVQPGMTILGISLAGINAFISRCGGNACLQNLTTADVCERFIKPFTAESKLSYIDHISMAHGLAYELYDCDKKPDEDVPQHYGTANLFISHAWKYEFLHVMQAIDGYIKQLQEPCSDTQRSLGNEESRRHGCSSRPVAFVWFDLFTNNQHESVERPFSWWCDTFMKAIKQIGTPLSIALCLFVSASEQHSYDRETVACVGTIRQSGDIYSRLVRLGNILCLCYAVRLRCCDERMRVSALPSSAAGVTRR